MSKRARDRKKRSGGGEPALAGSGLVPVAPAHAWLLKKEFSEAGARAWCCFTPFLYFTSEPGRNQVYWRPGEGGPLVFYRRERAGNVSWDIYTLAARDRKSAEEAVALADALNGGPARILWLPEDQLELIQHVPGARPEHRDTEYFYSPELVAPLRGPEMADVRKRANRFRREHPDFIIREMDARRAGECLGFLDKWTDDYYARGYEARPVDHFYTRRALEDFDAFQPLDFFGWVMYVGRELAGFAMAGEMTPSLANFFALKTDLSLFGLATFFRWYVLLQMFRLGYGLVNDASGLNVPGLERHKSKFRPVESLKIYKVNRDR